LQRYGRDAARIPTEGNRPGTPPSPDLVALNNLGNEAVRVEGEAMAIAVRFWERHDVEAAFYGASEAPSFGFRVDPGFLVIAGIARAQDTLRLNSLQEPFTVTRQHFVQATTRVLMQRARLMVGPITDSDLN
jgi:hypothetical protein